MPIGIPVPFPLPTPFPSPFPQPVIPSPSPTVPGPSPAIPFPSPAGQQPTFMQPFADLFKFPVNWRYIFGVIVLLITVQIAQQYDPMAAMVYAVILLLGVIVVDGRFGPELERLAKG